VRIDVYHHNLPTDFKLDKIIRLLRDIQLKEEQMSVELDAVTVQVTANEDLEQSAIVLIQGIAAQLAAIKDDPAKIQALADSLKVSADALAAAITANTPAA
jgi:hypothetical protein